MADDVQASLPSGNGERVELRIGTKALGFTTKDLVSVLLVVAMVVGFYLTVQALKENQDRGFKGQDVGFQKLETLIEVMHSNQKEILTALSILSYNIDRPPGERLPLNVPPEQLPPHQRER